MTLPVTVLCGFPDSAAHTVLAQVRKASPHTALGAVVPKKRSKRATVPSWMVATTPRFATLGQGCSCCTVRADLTSKLGKMADGPSIEHALVVAPVHDDLVPLAKTFTVADESRRSLAERAHLQSLVVVAAPTEILALESHPATELVHRLGLASVVVLLGGSEVEQARATAFVGALNPTAPVHVHAGDALPLESLRSDAPFDLDEARLRAMGSDILDGMDPAPTHPGVRRFAFHARRPFHPERLHGFLAAGWPGILRGLGAFWVASRPNQVGLLDLVGPNPTIAAGGVWWAAVPRDQRPRDPRVEMNWHPAYGDRRQELAWMGVDVDTTAFLERLEACLLTDDELETPEQWADLPHPFVWPDAAPSVR